MAHFYKKVNILFSAFYEMQRLQEIRMIKKSHFSGFLFAFFVVLFCNPLSSVLHSCMDKGRHLNRYGYPGYGHET